MLENVIKKYKKKMLKMSCARIATSIMVVVFIAFMIVMIEYAIPNNNIQLIIKIGILYFIVNILRMIATLFEKISEGAFRKALEAEYRKIIFLKLQHLKQKEIDQIRVGEILENMINDTKEASKYYVDGIAVPILGGVLRLIGTLVVLLYLNIPIVTITFLLYLFGFFITFLFNKKSHKFAKQKREINAQILNWSNEQVEGYQTIKALAIYKQRMKEIKLLITQYEKAVNQLEKNIRIYTCLYEYLVSFVAVINILMGSVSVEQGILSYGALVILARYIDQPEVYARWFIDGFQIRNISRISMQKISAILEKEEEDLAEKQELTKVKKMAFKAIGFSYQENQEVLHQISFEVNQNDSVALVGRTGSGKTSLVDLICRFYDLPIGSIKINGKDYKEYSIQSLRDKIGYIMQKVAIFPGTILENINYANKKVTREEIIEICKKLNLHEKIMTLKNGYDTQINADTDLLSVGEKQLLNFSRVMLQNPEIIILDEATASLSYKSEMLVRKAIAEITKNKISFIIAHRLSTIKNCNKILLMQDGKIIEEGNHEELMRKQGAYYRLING